jgi:hypothetical protein
LTPDTLEAVDHVVPKFADDLMAKALDPTTTPVPLYPTPVTLSPAVLVL